MGSGGRETFFHKGQWRRTLMFSLILAWINGWVNNGEAGDLRRHHAHYDVTVMHFKHQTDVFIIVYINTMYTLNNAYIRLRLLTKRYLRCLFYTCYCNKFIFLLFLQFARSNSPKCRWVTPWYSTKRPSWWHIGEYCYKDGMAHDCGNSSALTIITIII